MFTRPLWSSFNYVRRSDNLHFSRDFNHNRCRFRLWSEEKFKQRTMEILYKQFALVRLVNLILKLEKNHH
jgi:hypothetical protein